MPCACGLRCFDKLNSEAHQAIFDRFWKLSSFDLQNAHLCGCVKVFSAKRHSKAECESRRKCSRVYSGGVSVRIYKKAFLRIHAISNGRVNRVLQAQARLGGTVMCDSRGRYTPENKTSQEDVAYVKKHIESFPAYESHYSLFKKI